MNEAEKEKILRKAEDYLSANIRLISACQDEQQTMDCSNVQVKFNLRESRRASKAVGADGGIATAILLKILYKYANNPEDNGVPTFTKLMMQLQGVLKRNGYSQVPALSSSRPVSMNDEFSVIPKHFNGTRKALIIGIGYKGAPWELPGCHNDAWNMIKYLKTVHGFEDDDFTILLDDGIQTNPTRENIVKAFHRFAFSVKPGDAVFFHFAGHGSSVVNKSGFERSGFDQTLLPVDSVENGEIIDDEIFRILLIPLPKGLEMTAIIDACHSGTMFDLPFEFIGDARYQAGGIEMDYRKVTFPHQELVRTERRRIEVTKQLQKRASQIERIMVKPPMSKLPKRGPKKLKDPEKPSSRPAVQEEAKTSARENADEAGNCLLGCCLLCLNPVKLFRSLS
jgi:hypothetical protein